MRGWKTAPASRTARRSASISPWALTIPVSGDKSAPAERTWGSRAAVSGAESRWSSTPLAEARARSVSSAGSSSGAKAVMIFPHRRWGTSLRAHIV